MDAEASTGAVNDNIELYYLKFPDAELPTPYKQQRGSVIKYTKIADCDSETRASWGRSSCSLPPRLRRIISLDEPMLESTRSMKSNVAVHKPPTTRTHRKIVPINELEEADKMGQRTGKFTDRGTPGKLSKPKQQSHRAIQVSVYKDCSVGNSESKTSKESSRYTDSSAKLIKTNKSDVFLSRVNTKGKQLPVWQPPNFDNVKSRYLDDAKESPRRSKISNHSKSNISHRPARPKSDEKIQIKCKAAESQKQSLPRKRSPDVRSPAGLFSSPFPSPTVGEHVDTYPSSVIHVPIDPKCAKKYQTANPTSAPRRRLLVSQPTNQQPPQALFDQPDRIVPPTLVSTLTVQNYTSRCSETDDCIIDENVDLVDFSDKMSDSYFAERNHAPMGTLDKKDIVEGMPAQEPVEANDVIRWNHPIEPYSGQVGAAPAVTTVDRSTSPVPSFEHCSYTEKTLGVTVFEDLQIPDLALSKSEPSYTHEKRSLPSPKMPDLKISATVDDTQLTEAPPKSVAPATDSTSYIIGTLMYTTKQKINIQVVGDNASTKALGPISTFPLSVVSVFKKDLKKYQEETSSNQSSQMSNKCPFVIENPILKCENSSRLRKPSEIISSIRVSKSFLNTDFVSEQFERELNFIDSFFESLQYLESCSTQSQKGGMDRDKWLQSLEVDHTEYNSFLSKLEHGAMEDESDTIMSRSLCLLNLLIRDEQRRAKDLLFVLKMREDALKDYTKSQIIWLENKKKLDNTDISQLKKKQRGALLKLQYECGEMQRMRKALLALSEKRKAALMKTKKNIELKLTSDVDVEKILSKKKQLRRSSSTERTIPLKCFELSSSTDDVLRPTKCEEKEDTAPEHNDKPETVTAASLAADVAPALGLERSVAVDGQYLNIVFNDLAIPQMFRSGQQYEVDGEALRNILDKPNRPPAPECVDKYVGDVPTQEDKSTSPSTARSLVEELNQYYKDFTVGDKDSSSPEEIMSECGTNTETVYPEKPATVIVSVSASEVEESAEESVKMSSVEVAADGDDRAEGPLPVPAGDEAESPDAQSQAEPQDWPLVTSSAASISESSFDSLHPSSQPSLTDCGSATTLTRMASPVDCEAERLRLQQIAIEREIKALERQQQCQVIVVRSIPDKPPPPYCAPAESPRRGFASDAPSELLISQHLDGSAPPAEDAFDVFVADYCAERAPLEPGQAESDKPWEPCNQLPRRAAPSLPAVVRGACEDLRQVLSAVPPIQVSGLSSRRSDHIDDILFAEWRRCEPEWAALHVDEAVVKNQLFESIFHKVLTDTIDEYKTKVLGSDEG